MLGRKQEFYLKLQQLSDSVLLALTFWLAYALRSQASLPPLEWNSIPPLDRFYWQILIIVAFTPVVLEKFGFYAHTYEKSALRAFTQCLQGMTAMVGLTALVALFGSKSAESRGVLVIFFTIATTALLIRNSFTRLWIKRNAAKSGWKELVVLAGPPNDVEKLLATLPREQVAVLDIVDRIDISVEPVEVLVRVLHEKSVERVIFAAAHVHLNRIEEAVNACETEGVEAWLWADFIQTSIARPTFDALGGKPMLVFRCTPELSWALFVKTIIDRVGSATLMLFSAIPMLIAWIGVKLSSPGPAIFTQMRSGLHGRPFKMYKFRTMCSDAEERKAALMDQNQMSGPVFKIDRDPRIFPFGAFLRKWSIDELPQLVNVLNGDMSLVGPRPLPVYEVAKFSDAAHRRRLSVKPGLTCLWQISGRNDITDFHQWVELDLKYIDSWSLWLDFSILLRTVPTVLFRSGAR